MEFSQLAAVVQGIVLIGLSLAVWRFAWAWRPRGRRWTTGVGGRLSSSVEVLVLAVTVLLAVWGLANVIIAALAFV